MNELKYFSTFSGVGGFEIGIERALNNRGLLQGEDTKGIQEDMPDASLGQDWATCVGCSEIDKYASQVLKYRFPNTKNYGDIKLINEKELPDFDLFVGGFPCQSFSIAGKRGGFEDTRGTLIFEVFRILREKQPRFVLLENVKGLLSHDGGRTFKVIISSLAELGYAVEWQVLNAKNFGAPQNRERVFIVGHLGGFGGRKVFPIGSGNGECTEKDAQRNAYCLNAGGDKHRGTYVEVREATKQGYAIAEAGDSINLSVPNSTTRRGRVGKGIAQTLDTGMQQHTLAGSRIRRLTPTECMRLMSWPDDHCDFGIDEKGNKVEISDSQKYKMAGNGVVSNVVETIVKELFTNPNK